MSNYIPIAVSLVAALATIIVAWITIRVGRQKTEADAAETFTDIALSLVEPLQDRINILEALMEEQAREIKLLKKENVTLTRWSQVLSTQVLEAGHIPMSLDEIRRLEE